MIPRNEIAGFAPYLPEPWERYPNPSRPYESIERSPEPALPRLDLPIEPLERPRIVRRNDPPFIALASTLLIMWFSLMMVSSRIAPTSLLMLVSMSIGTGLTLALLGAALMRKLC